MKLLGPGRVSIVLRTCLFVSELSNVWEQLTVRRAGNSALHASVKEPQWLLGYINIALSFGLYATAHPFLCTQITTLFQAKWVLNIMTRNYKMVDV